MNNNINIAEILRDCPKGTKLYSPLFGEFEFQAIGSNFVFPIVTEILNEDCKLDSKKAAFTKDGNYFGIPNTECMLFPSQQMRAWSRFFKPGDVVIKNGGGMAAVFDGWANDTYTEFNTTVNLYCDGNTGEEEICSTILFRKADEEERKQFFKKVETILKGKYNLETLQVEPVKVECPFKPFDKVLVRNKDGQVWCANYFSHYKKNSDTNYPYVCIDKRYNYCIPYEGNERLLGTTDPYKEE